MCVNYRHLGPGARGKAAPNGRPRGGEDETRGAQTFRFPTFYARPRLPLDCGAFFRKSGTLAAEVSQKNFLATPQARESFFETKCAAWPSQSQFLAAVRVVLTRKPTLSLKRCCRRKIVSTSLEWECRFWATTRRTAATASVLRTTELLAAAWAVLAQYRASRSRGVAKTFACDTSSTRGSFLT